MRLADYTVMRRGIVAVIVLIVIALVGGHAAAGAGQTIVVIETMPVPTVLAHSKWFFEQMGALGYRDGDNARFVKIEADGSFAKAVAALERALEAEPPDIVVTFATLASQAAWKVLGGTTIPIVFGVVSDPVGAGLIQAPNVATGDNITGRIYTHFRSVKIDLALELARQVVPDRPIRFGYVHSSYPSSRGDLRALQKLCDARQDITLISREVPYREMPDGLAAMLADVVEVQTALAPRVDFWWQPAGPLAEVLPLTTVQQESGKAVLYANTLDAVAAGAVLTVNPDFEAGGREIADLADRILQGADPGDIPVTAPEAFNVGINLGTCLKLGMVVPPAMLELAGKNVYR